MTSYTVAGDGQEPKRALHVSAASLGTNASGIAGSTMSYAGSELSGISLFPAPPTELPTPTASNIGTPTSFSFAGRLPPSIPDYETPTRFRFGTPPSPRSPAFAHSAANVNAQDARSMASGLSSRTGDSNTATRKWDPSPLNRDLHDELPAPIQPPNPPPLPSQPSTSYQPVRPLTYRKNPLPNPPIAERPPLKRPETPHSVAAASSLLDWSDATSGISINPSEERLLTTSFITSLLSQAPDPFPREKYRTKNRDVRGVDKKDDELLQAPQGDTNQDAASPHRSIPLFYPSDLLSVDGREAYNSRAVPLPSADQRSIPSDSRRASKDYSDTFHSDEHLQPVIRRPSITVSRGGIEARPVGVMPAIRIPSTLVASNNSSTSSPSTSSQPPSHRAGAPSNVRRTGAFDGDGVPRESDEDFVKVRDEDLSQDRRPVAGPSAVPSTVDARNQPADVSPKPRSAWNQVSSSKLGLQRNQSMKSVVSSLVSRISNNSAVRRAKYLAWLRQRPLPPLPMGSNPPPEFPNGKEIQKSEEAIPLPTLAKRAEDLSGMLNRGSFPSHARDKNEFYYKESFAPDGNVQGDDYGAYVQIARSTEGHSQRTSLFSRFRHRKEEHRQNSSSTESASPIKAAAFERRRKRRKVWAIAVCVIVGMVLAIALPVGLSQRGDSTPKCSGNKTGASCTLDATCQCTGSSEPCKPLAQSLFLLVQDVNEHFNANFTASEMSDAVVNGVGAPANGLCDKQAALIDVEPGLDSASAPNRTRWAQAALLWNLGLSEDGKAATALQKFVSTAPWDQLSSVDGPVDDSSGAFVFNVSGYTFDFAGQSINPQSASFKNSSPSEDQMEEVSPTAEKALDRMYSFAIASSSQRENALTHFWTNVLQRQTSEMDAFREAARTSAFLLPFDATSFPGGNDLTSLMGNASSTQFPIPVSCYPGLNSSQLATVNDLETRAFGLDPASTTSGFSQDCFPDRPVYGVVDLLRLRLPFLDDRKGLALQASALSSDATIRAVIYAGEVLSAFPGSTAIPNITSATTDPREFGTVDFLDHVLLNYLSSISNITLAMNLVSYVLSPDATASDFASASSLSSLPVLEFAVFGPIRPQDIAFSVSSFSTPTGSLFFGSDAGQTFCSWALVNTSASIRWSESATSPEVVHEGSSVDPNFESVWQPASELVASGSTDAGDVQRVTSSLRSLGLFSP